MRTIDTYVQDDPRSVLLTTYGSQPTSSFTRVTHSPISTIGGIHAPHEPPKSKSF